MPGTIGEITATLASPTGIVWSEVEHDGVSEKGRLFYAAAGAPGVGDDSGDGFTIGSVWVDTTNSDYYVAKSVSVGAAVWLRMVNTTSTVSYTINADIFMPVTKGVVIGGAARITYASTTPSTQILGINTNDRPLVMASFNNSAGTASPSIDLLRSYGGTVGTNTVVANNTRLGQVTFRGADGTDYITAAIIRAEVDGTPGTSDMPGRLLFFTTADGAASGTERLRIDQAGRLYVNAGAAQFLDAAGRFVSGAGTEYTAANIASSAHAVNTTNKVQGLMVWDTTNHRMMRARGSGTTDIWDVIDGSASVTPS